MKDEVPLFRPPRRARTDPRRLAQDALDRQYREGLRVLEAPWARAARAVAEETCPSIPEDDLVRLFAGRRPESAESLIQAALFLEWNLEHRGAVSATPRARGRRRAVPSCPRPPWSTAWSGSGTRSVDPSTTSG